jgi:hypothetical protein
MHARATADGDDRQIRSRHNERRIVGLGAVIVDALRLQQKRAGAAPETLLPHTTCDAIHAHSNILQSAVRRSPIHSNYNDQSSVTSHINDVAHKVFVKYTVLLTVLLSGRPEIVNMFSIETRFWVSRARAQRNKISQHTHTRARARTDVVTVSPCTNVSEGVHAVEFFLLRCVYKR